MDSKSSNCSSIISFLIIALVIYVLFLKPKNKESFDKLTIQTNPDDSQFIYEDINTHKTDFVQLEEDNSVNIKNIPAPSESRRSDICTTLQCPTCDFYNPILMGMCKTECNIDPCQCKA